MSTATIPRGNTFEIVTLLMIVIATASFLGFEREGGSAFLWPAIDMAPFFERHADPQALANDFFSTTSSLPNPRHIFGYVVIALNSLIGGHWYRAFFVIHVLLVILVPVLYFTSLSLIARRYIATHYQLAQLLIAIAVLIILTKRFQGIFSIAWWSPLFIQATPQTLSLFFGLLAIVSFESSRSKLVLFGHASFAASTLLQPAIGLFGIFFYVVLTGAFWRGMLWKWVAMILSGWVLPVGILAMLFQSAEPLNTQEFINIYILNSHASHYHLPHFGSFTPFPWTASLGAILGLMGVPLWFSVTKGNRPLATLSFLSMLAYGAAVAFQYFFIDIVPSKLVAILGPVRFSQFGYWMVVILWVIMLCEIRWVTNLSGRFPNRIPTLRTGLFVLSAAILLSVGIARIDRPYSDLIKPQEALYAFLATTPSDSVIAVYYDDLNLRLYIPLLAKRAIFVGNGFPFLEDAFREYDLRYTTLYGTLAQRDAMGGPTEGDNIARFFRTLKPSTFVEASKGFKLDYLVVERAHSQAFSESRPLFENNKLLVFAVKDLGAATKGVSEVGTH